jgi:hypothetical protein
VRSNPGGPGPIGPSYRDIRVVEILMSLFDREDRRHRHLPIPQSPPTATTYPYPNHAIRGFYYHQLVLEVNSGLEAVIGGPPSRRIGSHRL